MFLAYPVELNTDAGMQKEINIQYPFENWWHSAVSQSIGSHLGKNIKKKKGCTALLLAKSIHRC